MYSRCAQLPQHQKVNKWGVTIPPVCQGCSQGGTDWLHRTAAQLRALWRDMNLKFHSQCSDHFQHMLHLTFMTSQKHQQNSNYALKIPLLKTLLCTVACNSLRGGQWLAKVNPCLSCTVPIFCVISPTLGQAFVTCLSAMNILKTALCCCFVFAQHLALMLLVRY